MRVGKHHPVSRQTPVMRVARLSSLQQVPVFAAILLTAAGPGRACVDACLRDAAFDEPRDLYRLAVMSESDDAEADKTYGQLKKWLATSGAGLNIEVARANVEDPQVRWQDYGIPSAPPTHPVVVLGRYRQIEMQRLFVDHWEPAPTPDELEQIRTSPARQDLQRELGRRLAVLLYIPGTGAGAGQARMVLDRVVRARSDKMPLGLSVVRVDRSDARERLLLAFTGALRSDSDWLAVVFGRGKFLPPIEGRDITAEALDAQLEMLLEDCACVRSVSSLGADIPMVWTKGMDEAVTRLRGPTSETPASQPSVPEPPGVRGEQEGKRILSVATYTLASLATAAVAAGGIIFVRQRQRQP